MGNITFNFKDYNVVITGAASGMGFASAKEFAKAGANIALIDYNEEGVQKAAEELRAYGVKAMPYVADVSNTEQVDNACAAIINDFNRKIDVVFCNAGVGQALAKRGSVETPDDAEWNRLFQINFMGDVRITKAFIPLLKEQKFGKILINSADAVYRPDPIKTVYCVTKAASVDYGMILAKELGPYNINVNLICPGFVNTPMYTGGTAIALKQFYPGVYDGCETSEDILNTMAKNCLIKTYQEPEEIAWCAMWLCSEEAKSFTGQVLHPDAGLVVHW